MVNKDIRDILLARGYDPDRTITLFEEVMEMCRKTHNAKAAVEAIKLVASWTGFDEKEKTIRTDTIEAIDYKKDLASLEESGKKLILTQKTEEDQS